MKDFLIIGNGICVNYKDVFPYIKDRNVLLGATKKIGGRLYFDVSECYEGSSVNVIDGKRVICVSSASWLTTFKHNCYEKLVLTKTYKPELYNKFDYYDAIDCLTKDIPIDYYEPIGVPLTFLDKWDGKEFEVLDARDYTTKYKNGSMLIKDNAAKVNGKQTFVRVLIRRKK